MINYFLLLLQLASIKVIVKVILLDEPTLFLPCCREWVIFDDLSQVFS